MCWLNKTCARLFGKKLFVVSKTALYENTIVVVTSVKERISPLDVVMGILGKEWAWARGSLRSLGEELIRRKLTLSSDQVETAIRRQMAGELLGMLPGGYGNFYLIETGNPENPVMIAQLILGGVLWSPFRYRLDFDHDWHVRCCFLFENLTTPTLEVFDISF
jgi:hypothetical protein